MTLCTRARATRRRDAESDESQRKDEERDAQRLRYDRECAGMSLEVGSLPAAGWCETLSS